MELYEEKPWLEEKEYVDFKQVLDPYPENQLIAYPVSSLVNKPSHDNAQVIDILQQFTKYILGIINFKT